MQPTPTCTSLRTRAFGRSVAPVLASGRVFDATDRRREQLAMSGSTPQSRDNDRRLTYYQSADSDWHFDQGVTLASGQIVQDQQTVRRLASYCGDRLCRMRLQGVGDGMVQRRAVSDTFLSHSFIDALDNVPPARDPAHGGFSWRRQSIGRGQQRIDDVVGISGLTDNRRAILTAQRRWRWPRYPAAPQPGNRGVCRAHSTHPTHCRSCNADKPLIIGVACCSIATPAATEPAVSPRNRRFSIALAQTAQKTVPSSSTEGGTSLA